MCKYEEGNEEQKMSKKTYKGETLKGRKKKRIRKILSCLLIFCIILVVIFSLFVWYIYSKLSKVNYVVLENIEVNEGIVEQLKGYRNVVLFGVDARANTYDGSRSDCIIIVSINQDTNDVKLTSIYRDTYVYIDGYGYDKITHAYAYGGPQLAINTINKNFDLNITEFVAVNFDAVIDIVDAVGGLDIDIKLNEIANMNDCISMIDGDLGYGYTPRIKHAGLQNLSGKQTLAYSRIRYTEGGDYKRSERMRSVLSIGYAKIKKLNAGKLNNLVDILLPKVYTNIPTSEIMSLLPTATKYNVTSSIGWPYEVQGITLDKWYAVPVTLENNVERLHKELFDTEDYEVSNKVKEYSNGIIKRTGYK